MGDIEQILNLERGNNKQIRLYKKGHNWLAFERSAFNLFSVSYVDSIIKITDVKRGNSVLVAVLKDGEDGLLLNPRLSILERTENEILLNSNATCGGFLYWKDSLLSMMAGDNLPDQDGESQIGRLTFNMQVG